MKKISAVLSAALAVLLVCTFLLNGTRTVIQAEDYTEKYSAADQTRICLEAICGLKQDMGIEIDEKNDINRTGVIGQDYSLITTTLGNIEAKRTSTNANMAAVVADMFHELGLQEGDKVAINCSGSFPALNIAVLCAVDVLGLDPLLISSFGSSTHGANDPELTWLDMEYYLVSEGLLQHKSDYFSIGGRDDIGAEMSQETVDTIVQRLKDYGYYQLYNEDLISNILERYQIYQEFGEIRCFINIGGNDVSFGDSNVIVHADGGILTELSERDGSTGLVQLFLKDGVPVIHLLNIKSIAAEYGLPIDPQPLPDIGEGDVYYEYHYNKLIAWAGVAAAAIILYTGRKCSKNRRKERNL